MNGQYTEHGEQQTIGEKYVPRPVFNAYVRMNAAFMTEHRKRRLTIRHASPPRYSQHTIAGKAAIDFRNIDGSPSSDHLEGFKDTVEYAWLRQHGEEFSFHESWPEANKYGMRAEPWHWQYRSSN